MAGGLNTTRPIINPSRPRQFPRRKQSRIKESLIVHHLGVDTPELTIPHHFFDSRLLPRLLFRQTGACRADRLVGDHHLGLADELGVAPGPQ